MSKSATQSTRDQVLAALAARREKPARLVPHEVEEWGVTIYIRESTLREQNDLAAAGAGREDVDMAKLLPILARTICDEDGAPLFDKKEVHQLMDESGPLMVRLINKINEVNGVDVEALKKSSEPTTT